MYFYFSYCSFESCLLKNSMKNDSILVKQSICFISNSLCLLSSHYIRIVCEKVKLEKNNLKFVCINFHYF